MPQRGMILRKLRSLAGRELRDLDFDPKLYFGQNRIEAGLTRRILEVGRNRLQARQRRGSKCACKQPVLELIERIERNTAAFDRALPPASRPFFALQRDQGIDAADRS